MSVKKVTGWVFALMVSCQIGVAHSAIIILDEEEAGQLFLDTSPTALNYTTEGADGTLYAQTEALNSSGYITYNLTGAMVPIVDASIEFNLVLFDLSFSHLVLYDVDVSPFPAFNPGGGEPGQNQGGGDPGQQLGSIALDSGSGTYDVPLNDVALDILNNADDIVTIGVAIFTDDVQTSGSASTAPVPAPGTHWLLGLGGLLIIRRAMLKAA